MPETNDYHYGGVMAYVDGVGIVVIGGTSSNAGRIEVFNEDDNEWKQIAQDRFRVHTNSQASDGPMFLEGVVTYDS